MIERTLQNRIFDELEIGETASYSRVLTTDDTSPLVKQDPDGDYKADNSLGLWVGVQLSYVLSNVLPGPGTSYVGESIRFRHPLRIGEAATITVRVEEKDPENHHVRLSFLCENEAGLAVATGTAEVIAPRERITFEAEDIPEVLLWRHDRYQRLIHKGQDLPPIRVGIVHPCDVMTLTSAVEAAYENIIIPVLIAPMGRIQDIAATAEIDITAYEQHDTAHSHESAEMAVELARAGKVDALMQGSLEIKELLHEVMDRRSGLQTGHRISHVALMDIPSYPGWLMLTDSLINIRPHLDEKQGICQNAIDLALALGIETPKLAILSASNTITPELDSTLEAAALCKMADRGQIKGGVLDGPLTFDMAINPDAAKTGGRVQSAVVGQANILLAPDLEAGDMLVQQLSSFGKADVAGIIVGAQVPIIVGCRYAMMRSYLASCAVASVLVAQRHGVAAAALAEDAT